MAKIELFQLNCHKSSAPVAKLSKNLGNYGIALIQEPNYFKGKLGGSEEHNTIFAGPKRPRAAILYGRGVNIWKDTRFCGSDLATAILSRENKPDLYLASLYLDIKNSGHEVIPSMFANLVDHCLTKGLCLIVGADTNAHSVLWGLETNRRGEILEDFLASRGLSVENAGCRPTFVARGTQSCIDATFSLGNPGVENWRVIDEDSLSDHMLIRFTVGSECSFRKVLVPDLSKANWVSFRSITEKVRPQTPRTVSQVWIETETADFINTIHTALRQACPQLSLIHI